MIARSRFKALGTTPCDFVKCTGPVYPSCNNLKVPFSLSQHYFSVFRNGLYSQSVVKTINSRWSMRFFPLCTGFFILCRGSGVFLLCTRCAWVSCAQAYIVSWIYDMHHYLGRLLSLIWQLGTRSSLSRLVSICICIHTQKVEMELFYFHAHSACVQL